MAGALASGPTVTSTGQPAGAPVNGSPYPTVVSATAWGRGYILNLVDGELTVNPAPLISTADDATRTYGAPSPAFSASFVAGDDASDLSGSITSPAIASSPVGPFVIEPSGLTNANYAITHIDGTLTVNPTALTITADNASKTYGKALSFAETEFAASGLVAGDTVSSVSFSNAGAPAGAGAGSYGIRASNAQGPACRTTRSPTPTAR